MKAEILILGVLHRGNLDNLADITAPTLLLQGDRDEVTVEHSLAVVAALPEARLAVLRGTHTLPVEHPELVNR
jgi:pimeloyl-ACP methyl ester carboxylesterase